MRPRGSVTARPQDPFTRAIRRMGWFVVLGVIVWGTGLKLAHLVWESHSHGHSADRRD